VQQSPASRILIYGIFFSLLVIMAFAFFALTGGTLKPGGTFSMSLSDVVYEPVAPDGGRRAAPVRQSDDEPRRPADDLREPTIPETPAEEQYYAAVQKAQLQEQSQAERLKSRDNILRFLESPLGKDLRAVSELARRGRTREAKDYLPKVLKALEDQNADPAVQAFALKLAVLVFRQEKDQEQTAAALKKYMELLKNRLMDERAKVSNREKESMPDALKDLDDLLKKVEGRGGR
jgi:hypothetical protein